jgi:hypothetical protein
MEKGNSSAIATLAERTSRALTCADPAIGEHVSLDRLAEYLWRSTVRSVHHQAPRSLSLPLCRGSHPGVAPRGIGKGSRHGEGFRGR